MKVYSSKGELEVVCYTLTELVNENEYNFCKALYEHTEGIKFDDGIFFDAQSEVDRGCDYTITDDDDPKNKIRSWIDCLRFFKQRISSNCLSNIGDVQIGFEYHLKKRWVDAIIVCNDKIIIMEFKSGKSDDVNQIKGYLKQLKRYSNRVRRCNKEVVKRINAGELILESYLVFTNTYMKNRVPQDQTIIVGDEFEQVLLSITAPAVSGGFELLLDGKKYIDPSISGALSLLIHEGIVSYVEKDNSNVDACTKIMHEILNSDEPMLGITIVKGGPGTGKTGTAFTLLEECLCEGITDVQYVTGNGNLESYFNAIVDGEIALVKQEPSMNPLFEELLGKGIFDDLEGLSEQLIGHIRELYSARNYCDNCFFNKGTGFLHIDDRVLLVDEAQRMWNYSNIATRKKYVCGENVDVFDDKTQRIVYANKLSEAYLLLFSAIKGIEMANANKDAEDTKVESKNVVLFIGNGQEINNGEEDGEKDILNSIYLLSKINSDVKLKVFVSDEKVKETFSRYGVNCELRSELVLKSNQRNDEGDPELEVVTSILNGDSTLPSKQNAYEVHNDFEALLKSLGYEKDRTYDKDDESIGIVIDSYDCDPATKGKYILLGKELSDASGNLYKYYYQRTSNKLESFVSEFGCQGLEFDDTILIWGNTLLWRDGKWVINPEGYEAISKKGNKYTRSRYLRLEMHVEDINDLASSVNGDKAKLLSVDEVIEKFVKNAYRVLLTRARENTYIYVEDKTTYEHLKNLLEPVEITVITKDECGV